MIPQSRKSETPLASAVYKCVAAFISMGCFVRWDRPRFAWSKMSPIGLQCDSSQKQLLRGTMLGKTNIAKRRRCHAKRCTGQVIIRVTARYKNSVQHRIVRFSIPLAFGNSAGSLLYKLNKTKCIGILRTARERNLRRYVRAQRLRLYVRAESLYNVSARLRLRCIPICQTAPLHNHPGLPELPCLQEVPFHRVEPFRHHRAEAPFPCPCEHHRCSAEVPCPCRPCLYDAVLQTPGPCLFLLLFWTPAALDKQPNLPLAS